MIRVGVLLALIVLGRTDAAAAVEPHLDQTRLIAVYQEAFTFVVPRILDPVPINDLTFWGLQGLNAIDPSLHVVSRRSRLQLFHEGALLLDVAIPTDASPVDWATALTRITAAGFSASGRVREAGTQGVIMSFFDQMFSRLDPYSRYVPPIEAGRDREQRAGKASLGLSVAQHGAIVMVTAVVRDSPAAISGFQVGDVIDMIDGQYVAGQDPGTITALLAGAEGSLVKLSWRTKTGRMREAAIARAIVPSETVFAQRIDNVLLLRITGFSGSTASHIAQAVQDALADNRGVDGIVLDLRDNHGGLLRQAVTAADTFLPAGPIATTIGRDPEAENAWHSTDGELAENVPLVILVDGRTASAAEIMAAALADRGRAVVVGSVTVGKGLVQTIDPLPDGGELFVTWSQLLAPLGWPIQGLGVMPQVCTSLGRDALKRELSALANGVQPMTNAVLHARNARLPLTASQVLEIRAACPAAIGSSADLDVGRLLISNPAAYATALLPPIVAQ